MGSKEVAIKMLKLDSSKVDAEDLDNELNVLQLLHHPYIVRLAGAGQTPQVPRVYSTMSYGLYTFRVLVLYK